MEYTIEHRTTYVYPDSVDQSYTVLHLAPRSDHNQFCTRFALDLAPRAKLYSYADRYGNDVHHFAILPPHSGLSITAHSNVVTLLPHDPRPPVAATRELLRADDTLPQLYDFLHESAYVQFSPELEAFAAEVEGPIEDVGGWVHAVSRHIHESFSYDTQSTTVRSTVGEALAQRSGVCQDYAHIMIGVLRQAGVPARYVSGYIFRGDSNVLGVEASHAWCEAYLPPYGWIGFDPTNDRIIDDHFVKIAFGRDYLDVSPVRGIYRGPKQSEMQVKVGMEVFGISQ